ncbi:hypothetical protein GIB67_040430 [Kingdonia uniflora]|uniref:Glucan endo-1,3-beta-D-glucosidase n=1 Tax=Kingdonia uniflora TaxID=39325 RepID=A0A7J7KXM0_9MAGN|nr:hypothetical protein GIB67_040430 [Kingdonia uniflora]
MGDPSELDPNTGEYAENILPAMENLDLAVKAANLVIRVSTIITTAGLGSSYPPLAGEFGGSVSSVMQSIIGFLAENRSPLLVNVYPYFSLDIRLNYSLFGLDKIVVQDSTLGYTNLFDAVVDATYSAALEKIGASKIEIVVSESKWPSAGNGDVASIGNAETCNNNLIKPVSGNSGTPKRLGKSIEVYVFAIFKENLKP